MYPDGNSQKTETQRCVSELLGHKHPITILRTKKKKKKRPKTTFLSYLLHVAGKGKVSPLTQAVIPAELASPQLFGVVHLVRDLEMVNHNNTQQERMKNALISQLFYPIFFN